MMKLRHVCSLQVPVSEPLTPDPTFPLFSDPSKRNIKPAFCLHRRMVIILPKGWPRGAHQSETLKHFLILPAGCQYSFRGRSVSFIYFLPTLWFSGNPPLSAHYLPALGPLLWPKRTGHWLELSFWEKRFFPKGLCIGPRTPDLPERILLN